MICFWLFIYYKVITGFIKSKFIECNHQSIQITAWKSKASIHASSYAYPKFLMMYIIIDQMLYNIRILVGWLVGWFLSHKNNYFSAFSISIFILSSSSYITNQYYYTLHSNHLLHFIIHFKISMLIIGFLKSWAYFIYKIFNQDLPI